MSREQVLGRLGLMKAERAATAARLVLATIHEKVKEKIRERDEEVSRVLLALSDDEILSDPDLLEFFLRESDTDAALDRRAGALTFCHKDVFVWWGHEPGQGWIKPYLSLTVERNSDGVEQAEAIRAWWGKFAMGRDVLPNLRVVTSDTDHWDWEIEISNPLYGGWGAVVVDGGNSVRFTGSLTDAVAFVGKHVWGY